MKKTLKKLLCLLLVVAMTITCLPIVVFAEEAETTETESVENETELSHSQGDIISFGSYPQSEVTDETLKATLTGNAGSTDNWTSYNYYIDGAQSDYMKYTDIELDGEKYRGVYFTKYRPENTNDTSSDSCQDDNGYNTNTIYWFKYEPILWKILSYDETTGSSIVLSKSVLDSQEFYDNTNNRTIDGNTVYPSNYEYSNIRAWLNESFYNVAFNFSEKGAIVATTLDNRPFKNFESLGSFGGNSTTDNIWLLSYTDACNADYGFVERADLIATGTNYAKSQGLLVNSKQGVSWRVRTALFDSISLGVASNGGFLYCTSVVNESCRGVRPALTVNLKSDVFSSCEHTFDVKINKNTCTEKGYTQHTCTKCGTTYKSKVIEATGHRFNGTAELDSNGKYKYLCENCNEYLIPSSGDTFVGFGSYPQTEVTDETLKASLAEEADLIDWKGLEYQDLLGIKNGLFKDITFNGEKYRCVEYCLYRPYDVSFVNILNYIQNNTDSGEYTHQDENGYLSSKSVYWFKYEPLEWQILSYDSSTNSATLLSKNVIDAMEFSQKDSSYTQDGATVYPNNYQYSTVREWLNGTFFNTAFTPKEMSSVFDVTLDNSAYSTDYSCYDGGQTTDKVWLLSYAESQDKDFGFVSCSPVAKDTDYAKVQGVWSGGEDGKVYWKLRTPGNTGTDTVNVYTDGKTNYYDYDSKTYIASDGIRPAIKIDLTGGIVDITPPKISSVTPADYSVLTGSVNIVVNALDNIKIEKYDANFTTENGVAFSLDCVANDSGCKILFDTASVPDGVVTFTVNVYDYAGNVSEQTLTYKIDNTGPDIVSAFKVIALHPTQLTLSWEKPLDEDLAYFVLEQKCGENKTVLNSNFNSLGYNVLNLTPDTEYSYRVKCVDQYGNEGEYTDWLTVTTTTDTTAPVVTSQSKNAGAYNKSVTYSATVKDDYAIKSIDIEYSYDKVTWTKIDGFEYGVDNKTANVSLPIDLTAYNEGSIYIRAVGTDKFGNVGDTSENAPFVEYLVDRTAPDSVDIKSTVVTDKTITVNWNACTATDVKSYSVYRSTSADGEYKCIAGNIKYLNYNDTSVSRNTEYFYKVAAIDNAGNVGELGNYGSAYVYEDAIAPNIASVSPKNTTIGPVNKTVSIFATDNDNLKNIIVEMKTANDTDFSVYKTFDVSGASKTVTFNMPLESFSHGDTAQIRVKAVDAVGLSSDTVTCSYTIDKLAPNADALSVVGNEGNAVVTWKDCGEGDLSGFEIYRCTGTTETRIASRSVNTSGSYKITDTAEFESVRYRIDAVDRYGNKNSFYSVSVSTVVILNPNVTLPNSLETETSLAFSAASTKSYYGVSEYKWSFSDGVTLTGATVYRKFDTAGSYSVTLTVADVQGNTKEKVTYFNIKEKVKTGKLKVTITDTNGYAISGCNVYLDVGSDNVETIQASSSGIAVKELPAGTHEIGAYLDGYLPDTKTVVIENDKTTEVTFKLTKQNIVTGEFKVREMTFEEIKEKGIDINNPDNQQIYEVNVTLIYGEQKIPVTYYRTNTEIKNYVIKDSGGTASNGVKYEYKLKYIPNKQNKEIIAVVRLPIHASYLKQFFLATLTIINNASEDFELVDCTTDITIPDGLTLMDRTPISSTIKGGSCDSETLVLRGDKAGEYNLSAKFSGTLKGFNENITASFESNSFKVYDKNTVKLVIEIPEQTEGRFRFNIGLENTRESDVYCPQINIDGMVTDITEMYKKTLQNRTDISDSDIKAIGCQALDSFVRDSDGKVTLYSEKGMPVDKIEPGQGVFVEYETISMLADGASGYFSDAIIDIEDALGGFVEIRYIGTINVDENTYIKEHIDFINGSDYGTASYDIASDMKDSIKNSAEYVELQILDLEGTLSTWAEEFTSALGVSNEFNDALCADYIEKLIDNATESGNIELKFFENLKEIINDVTDVISIPDDSTVDKDLWKNKIDGILEGTDYDSDTNKLFNSLLGKYMKDETIDRIYGKYDNINNILSIYQECNSLVEGIKKLNVYCAAVATYQELSDEIKDILIRTADEVENEQLKSALQRYANTAIDGAALKEELRGAAKQFFIQNAYDFFNFSYGSILKKAIKKFAVNKLASVLGLSASAVSADLSLSLMVITAARKIMVAASGADKKRAAIYMLIRLSDVTSASAKVLEETKTELLSERDIKSALSFDTAYKMFKQWNLMAYDAYEDYGAARTDNFLEKYIVKKNRQKNLDGLADIISMKNIVNGIFCHSRGHEYGTDAKSKNTKVVAVACPVDVKLYSHDGTLAAQVISNEATVYDESVSCMVIDDTKLFAVPSELDYRVEITATGDGTMDYTVMEYSDNTETRKVTFPTQSIVTGDVFTGSTGVNKTEEVPVYALTKNSTETINAENAVDIIATGITVDKEEISLDIGNTDTVTATVETVGDDSYILYSDDDSICTVDENGVITAVGVGETDIYAASVDGGYIATTRVTVNEHKYDAGKVLSAATCTTEGKTLFTCTVCSATYTKTEPALGHAYGEWHTKSIPTCTENGTNERVCANNASHIETQTVAATGHIDNDNDGTCDNCGTDLGTNNPANNCKHMCHKTKGILKFFWKIFNFFNKLFKIKQYCSCGAKHWQ